MTKQANPTFSIIIPTYNRGYCIWKAIQSVHKQIYPFWELFVIDDGSTDNTQQVVAEFQTDPRIHYEKIKKSSANTARNYGFDKTKGEFIVYLDSDDILYENFLSVNKEYFKKYPETVFAIPNYNRRVELYNKEYKLVAFTDSSSVEKENMTLEDIYLRRVKGSGSGTVYMRKIFEKGIRWDESLLLFEDWDFKMQIGRVFPNGFLHIPYVLFEYRQRYGTDGTCSNASYGEWAKAFEQIYVRHKDDPLMKGQTWYPRKVAQYKKMQEDFEKGLIQAPEYKFFPEYFKQK